MATIKVKNLTFYYDGSFDIIFKDISLEIDTKWQLGFCGRNGRGKTTFMKLLMGEFEYRGQIVSDVTFDYFPFTVVNSKLNVLELLFEIVPKAKEWRIRKELSLLAVGVDVLERPFETLSSGEQTKVMLVGLFLKENNFLLIDEPTNHLDREARQVIAKYLNLKNGFILISHDRDFLDACTDHTLSINKTNIEIVKGSFSSWWEQTARQESFELAQNEKLSEEISQMERTARQNKFWAHTLDGVQYNYAGHYRSPGSREARLRRDAKRKERHVIENIEAKKKLLRNVETKKALGIDTLESENELLVQLSGVDFHYDERTILSDFSLEIRQGDRIAITGRNGTGKSSIMRLINGELTPTAGTVELTDGLTISYVPQDVSWVSGSLTDFANESKIDLEDLKDVLVKLDFSDDQLDKNMKYYSAGQKKKVLLARSLSEKAHLYIWDEPLNYIDVISRMQIEELLIEYQPTMIFVEHDVAFVRNVASRTIQL